jgi:hypothetical protein
VTSAYKGATAVRCVKLVGKLSGTDLVRGSLFQRRNEWLLLSKRRPKFGGRQTLTHTCYAPENTPPFASSLSMRRLGIGAHIGSDWAALPIVLHSALY